MDLKDFRKVIMLPMITGHFPFNFSVDRLKFNFLLFFYGLLVRVLFCFLCSLSVFLKTELKISNNSRLYNSSIYFNIFLLLLSSIASYISLILNIKQLSHAININIKVDKQFSIHGIVKSGGLIWAFHLSNLLLILGTLIAGAFLYPGSALQKFIIGLVYLYMMTNFYMSVYPFMMMLDRARTQFKALRAFLQVTSSRAQIRAKFELSVRLHSLLCQICKDLNSCYNWQLLLLYLVIFTIVITNSYYFIDALGKEIWLLCFFRASIILFYCATGYLVIYFCKQVSLEAKEFNTMMYQSMLNDQIDEISTNIKLRLHLSMKKEVVFTACGFFTLDNTLIHSMIAAATTYLVILVQFGQAA